MAHYVSYVFIRLNMVCFVHGKKSISSSARISFSQDQKASREKECVERRYQEKIIHSSRSVYVRMVMRFFRVVFCGIKQCDTIDTWNQHKHRWQYLRMGAFGVQKRYFQ